VAAREAARGGAGCGLGAARGVAAGALAVRRAHPAVRARLAARALGRSSEMTRGRLRAIVPPLVLWWVLITLAAIAITWACRQVSDAASTGRASISARAAARGRLPRRVDRGRAPLRRPVARRAPVPRHAPLRGAARSGAPRGRGRGRAAGRALARRGAGRRRRRARARRAGARGRGVPRFPARLARERRESPRTRGASAVAPENSMAAFRAAMEAGATYPSSTCSTTRDRRLVVVHDGDLLRMAGDPRRIVELTAEEIAAIDIGRRHPAAARGRAPAAARGRGSRPSAAA